MKSFNLRAITPLLRKHRLNEMPMVGRGMFSAVYDAGSTVLKLTTDIFYLDYLRWCCDGEFFPRMIDSRDDELPNGTPIYLIELEKLQPLRNGSAAKKMFGRFRKDVRAAKWDCSWDTFKALERVAETYEKRGDVMHPAVDALATFASNFKVDLDLHSGNVMTRGDQLVITDPFVDRAYVQSECIRQWGGLNNG